MEASRHQLDLSAVSLADLALALEDHSDEQSWRFDPVDGTVAPFFSWNLENPGDRSAHDDLIPIEPLPSSVVYNDMRDFAARVRDPQARELLEGALRGRGAFRRFKDLLELDFPELRRAWFGFHDVRAERRAIEWLLERGLVGPRSADEGLAQRPDPDLGGLPSLLDAEAVSRRVANDLRRIYQDRLTGVLLVNSWARGDAHPESPLELVVVLDRISDRWNERRELDRVMWRHSVRNNTVIGHVSVTESELQAKPAPRLTHELLEGVRVAVTGDVQPLLARSREELNAAHALLDSGFSSQAPSRAYLAAFDAACAALLTIGEMPHTHSGVISAFARRIVGEGGLDHEIGRGLRRLYDDRAYVDYRLGEPAAEESSAAIQDAQRLLDATVRWIDVRSAAA